MPWKLQLLQGKEVYCLINSQVIVFKVKGKCTAGCTSVILIFAEFLNECKAREWLCVCTHGQEHFLITILWGKEGLSEWSHF